MLLVIYRGILLINLGISTGFSFGYTNSDFKSVSPWAYYLQMLLLILLVLLLILNTIAKHKISSRFFFAVAYCAACVISTEVLIHGNRYPGIFGNSSFQIYWYILEVILCAILLKNDFHKEVSLATGIKKQETKATLEKVGENEKKR